MPPQANDNQGLKIAVAVFVTLSVFLAVATYFGFSEASKNAEKADQATKDASTAKTNQQETYRLFEQLKERAGFKDAEDTAVQKIEDALKAKHGQRLTGIAGKMQEAAAKVKEAAGADAAPEIDLYTNQATSVATNFVNNAQTGTETLDQAVDDLVNMAENQAQLLAAIGAHYQLVRRDLENANQIAQSKVQAVETARDQVQADHMAELTKHEEDRQGLVNRLDELQNINNEQSTQINTLTNELAQTRDEWSRRYNDLMSRYRQVREQLEMRNENTLVRADGHITFVDFSREEVRTTLSRRDGAREQLVFSVFDKNAPGLPTDSPKATIELIRVTDTGSIGRIVRQMDTINPIRIGDQVYSPAFGRQTFALIGKIDVDRDGRDDREDLKRMIRAAGGEIAYDLPPPGQGPTTGELTPSVSWYVLDERKPLRGEGVGPASGATGEEEQQFLDAKSKALTEARLAGIRPIAIERLLDYIGYTYGQPVPGQTEARDPTTINRLLNPEGRKPPTTDQPPTEEPPADSDSESAPPDVDAFPNPGRF